METLTWPNVLMIVIICHLAKINVKVNDNVKVAF